mgnify:CR=1 FL=1
MKNGYSMKQIADEIDVSKMKIYRTITKNHYKECYKKGQTLYYDETVKDLVRKEVLNIGVTSNHNNQKSSEKNDFSDDKLVNTLMDRIDSQKAQIINLTKLLDQSQQLQLMAEKKIAALEAPKETETPAQSSKDETAPETVVENQKKEPRPQKQGFWHRIFK